MGEGGSLASHFNGKTKCLQGLQAFISSCSCELKKSNNIDLYWGKRIPRKPDGPE